MSATSASRQLPLNLAHRPAFGAEDFFVSQSNEMAVRLIDEWPNWPEYGQLLIGPMACGKSHLVNVWRLRSNATCIDASELMRDRLEHLHFQHPVYVENIDGRLASEEALFHLINLTQEQGGQILLTSRLTMTELDIQLRDLRSRLLALPVVVIDPPDDDLLKAVMVKQFADRHLEVEPQLVEYLFKRIERSMRAVSEMVDALDRHSLGARRRISKSLAREIIANFANS